jgi:hypothetical protein
MDLSLREKNIKKVRDWKKGKLPCCAHPFASHKGINAFEGINSTENVPQIRLRVFSLTHIFW